MIESALYHCSSCMTMMPWATLWVTSSDGVRVKRSPCLMPALKASRHMSVHMRLSAASSGHWCRLERLLADTSASISLAGCSG